MGWGQKASILGWRVPTNPTQPSFASYTYFAFGLFVCLFVLYYSLSWVISKKYMHLAWNMRWTCQILQRIILKYVFHPKKWAPKMWLLQIGQIFFGKKVKLSWNMRGIQNILCIWKCLTNISVVSWSLAAGSPLRVARHTDMQTCPPGASQAQCSAKIQKYKYTNTQIHKYTNTQI